MRNNLVWFLLAFSTLATSFFLLTRLSTEYLPRTTCFENKTDWQCCVSLDGNDACAHAKYLEEDVGIEFDFKVDNYTLIYEEISVRNPPPLCTVVPEIKNLIRLCLRFYDIEIGKRKFKGCIEAEAYFIHLKVKKIKIGCFNFTEIGYVENVIYKFSDNHLLVLPVATFQDSWNSFNADSKKMELNSNNPNKGPLLSIDIVTN